MSEQTKPTVIGLVIDILSLLFGIAVFGALVIYVCVHYAVRLPEGWSALTDLQ